jgi:hypothetical protein
MESRPPAVLECRELPFGALGLLFARWGVEVVPVAAGAPIPGSYWGEPVAGIRAGAEGEAGARLFVRPDTPVHSALHEGCHLVCASAARRGTLDTDAGGDFAEEDAVCYLQIVLAEALPGVGRARMLADMDAWGYTFRLGSAGAWFAGDAEDARGWLVEHGVLDGGLAARAAADRAE